MDSPQPIVLESYIDKTVAAFVLNWFVTVKQSQCHALILQKTPDFEPDDDGPSGSDDDSDGGGEGGTGEVVSLDKFRKK